MQLYGLGSMSLTPGELQVEEEKPSMFVNIKSFFTFQNK